MSMSRKEIEAAAISRRQSSYQIAARLAEHLGHQLTSKDAGAYVELRCESCGGAFVVAGRKENV